MCSKEELDTRFFHAVARGNLMCVKRLIADGAGIDAHDYHGSSALHIAAGRNLLDIVLFLIDLGADIHGRDAFGKTPLLIAMEAHHCVIAAVLRRSGDRSQSVRRCVSDGDIRCFNAEAAITHHFPAPVVNAIIQGKAVDPISKPSVSIFFSDIADYSILRGSMEPATICCMLERLFSKLDKLAALHSVQRVDAIDGCYIAAANFSAHQPTDHAVRLAQFALDAMAAATTTAIDEERPELGPVRLLAGMHCGTVCGSVVGALGGRKYTLLGDAVNVASRMGSNGAAGAVQCSAASAAQIEAQGGIGRELELLARDGGVEVKGRGHMAACWLRRSRSAAAGQETQKKTAADGNASPPGPAFGRLLARAARGSGAVPEMCLG
jgi:class 3 adenylate cyclase